MTNQALTETQFAAVQDKIDALARSTRKGTQAEKVAFSVLSAAWERALALPQTKAADREARRAMIFAVAVEHGLV